jgi:CrcB protein
VTEPRPIPIDPELAPSDPAEPSATHHPATRPRPSRARPAVLAAIAIGGAVGAPARYEMTRLVHPGAGGFPWATFWVNVTGSFLLGVLLVVFLGRWPSAQYLRPFIAVGVLGAFTTYSTYMVDADLLVHDHHVTTAVLYLLSSVVVGLIAVWAGIVTGRAAVRNRATAGVVS